MRPTAEEREKIRRANTIPIPEAQKQKANKTL